MYHRRREHIDKVFRTVAATTAEHMAHAMAVRSICFLEERGFAFGQEFDGNDYHASHFVMYADNEPIGTCRVRWFSGFARIEKMAFRVSYRGFNILRLFTGAVFSHVAQKGYSKLIAVADEEYSRLWERLLGFKKIPGRVLAKPGRNSPYYELVKELGRPSDTVDELSPPEVLFRIEGAWNVPGTFG